MPPKSGRTTTAAAVITLHLENCPDVIDMQTLADLFGVDVSTMYSHHRDGSLGIDPIPWGGRLRFSKFSVEQLLKGQPNG